MYFSLFFQEFILAKYIYACVIQTVGQVKEDLLGFFLPVFNVLVSFFTLIVFVVSDLWPNTSQVAMYAGVDPSIIQAKKDSHPMFDPSVLVNFMGPTTLLMATFVWLKVAAKKRKIGMVPAVNNQSPERDSATGLPLVPLAPLAMDLGRVMFMVTLIISFVAIPSLLLERAMKKLSIVMQSPTLSFLVSFYMFFKYYFVVLIIVPTAIFVSNSLFRSFVIKSIRHQIAKII